MSLQNVCNYAELALAGGGLNLIYMYRLYEVILTYYQ